MTVRNLVLAVALTTAPVAVSHAKAPAPAPITVKMDLAATDAIRSLLGDAFDEGQVAMLQALGHQQAVAAVCDGFEIDPAAFQNEFDLIYDDQAGKPRSLDSGQRAEIERKATLALGMAFGAQIAISANDHPAFCKAAGDERAAGKATNLVWTK
ncbi:Putative secreted protein [Sphingopyxis fribergensis]|uniref:Putative secreted protein n=1 Tax=Sphingopyxis fribergensis TaxID=1515612 RepID=A0A0A7PGG6_9SPHN|nr:hypothetical protein [Sphingopyxis fribergensis]AJA08323.1 Putative secreted protein [Sphingopyxis fribergensis]